MLKIDSQSFWLFPVEHRKLCSIFSNNLNGRRRIDTCTCITESLYCTSETNTILFINDQFSSVQSLSHVRLFATPWTAIHQASLSITNSQSLPKLMSIESVMPSNHFILYHPILLLPSIRVFSNESALHIRWPKYWSFSFNISPSNEHPGLISSRMDWLDLLEVQRTLKSLLQHHSSKALILLCSAFFIVQLSHKFVSCHYCPGILGSLCQ